MTSKLERAVFAGGCFWGMQDLIRKLPGVVNTRLEFFFQIHVPTTLNRHGNDVGTSYRSEIFYVSEAQRDEALRTIDDVNASGLWPGRVVTKVSPAGEFWEAEPEHQDYLERYPLGYTCHFPRPGWKLPRHAGAAA
jgi:peptide-methionine (S)-S-oxide reductase